MLEGYYLKVDETPLRVWRKCHEGEFSSLRKDSNIGTEKDDALAWRELYDNYIQTFGISQILENYLELVRQKIDAQIEYLESNIDGFRDEFLLNSINFADAEISEFIENNKRIEGLSIGETIEILSKMQGYHINENDYTVSQYMNLLKIANNGTGK